MVATFGPSRASLRPATQGSDHEVFAGQGFGPAGKTPLSTVSVFDPTSSIGPYVGTCVVGTGDDSVKAVCTAPPGVATNLSIRLEVGGQRSDVVPNAVGYLRTCPHA
jgi:hypothetical protein